MDEHRTAAPADAGPRIVINFHNEIVQMVGASQPIAWFIGRPLDGAVIASVGRVFAPGVSGADAADRQEGPRPRQPVGPPPQPYRAEMASRRGAVPLALVGRNTRSTERNRQGQRPGKQKALRPPARPRANADKAKRNPSHTLAVRSVQWPLALLPPHVLLRAKRRGKVAATGGDGRLTGSAWRLLGL